MKVDERVNRINALIKENARAIDAGDAPDMRILETEINEFINILGQLPPAQVRDYANLVNIWAAEAKRMSVKLQELKTTLRAEMKTADTRGKAHLAYSAGQKPTNS